MGARTALKNSNLAQEIHYATGRMSRSERKIARVLQDTNFQAGLASVASLASQANVSGPTVIRFTTKLGFTSYRHFQEAVNLQFNKRIESPATLYRRASLRPQKTGLAAVSESIINCVQSTFGMINPDEFEKIAKILGDERRNVCAIGGQSSELFADFFAARLYQFRQNVRSVSTQPLGYNQENQLPFLGRRDVVVAFDFRRYQESTIFFTSTAASQGATIILVTDTWLSPIVEFARHVLTVNSDDNWPYDFFTPCLALLEAMLAVILSKMDSKTVDHRIQLCEQYSKGLLGGNKPSSEQ